MKLDVGEWSASHPGRFNLGTDWIGGWVGSRMVWMWWQR